MSRREGVYATERIYVAGDGPTQRVITVEIRAFWPPDTPWTEASAALVKTFVRARKDMANQIPDSPEGER